VQPILHLSIPVRDMDAARDFYVHALGCRAARTRADFTDVWFYGMQVTLQDRPDEAPGLVPGGSRHFGVTLNRADFEEAVARLEAVGAQWVAAVSTDDAGLATEQTKCKVADPSGNVIELKTYRDVGAALETSEHSYPEEVARGN
jgi:extradiol dioxygenase family protein